MKDWKVIRLDRIQLTMLGWLLILMCFFASQFTTLFLFERTTGKVTGYNTVERGSARGRRGKGTPDKYAIVQIVTGKDTASFEAVENLDLYVNDEVPVLYDPSDPEDAYVYTFSGFWLMKIIYFSMICGVWGIFATSYVAKKEYLSLNFRDRTFGKERAAKDANSKGKKDEWNQPMKLE